MKKLCCMLGFTALVLTSCSSSDSSSSTTTESDVLLKKIVETYANDGSTLTTNFTYNGKKIVKAVSSDGGYENFTYTGDVITKIEYYDGDDALGQTDIYTYDSSNRLVSYVRKEWLDNLGYREMYVYNSDGTVSMTGYSGDTTSQTNQDQTGVIHFAGLDGEVGMIETTYEGSSFITTHTYTYDTKNNPFMNVIGTDKIQFVDSDAIGFRHNITSDTQLDPSGSIVTSTTYTYNALNFPLTDTETEDGDPTSTISTQYTYN